MLERQVIESDKRGFRASLEPLKSESHFKSGLLTKCMTSKRHKGDIKKVNKNDRKKQKREKRKKKKKKKKQT